jgi:hypothetical protein
MVRFSLTRSIKERISVLSFTFTCFVMGSATEPWSQTSSQLSVRIKVSKKEERTNQSTRS